MISLAVAMAAMVLREYLSPLTKEELYLHQVFDYSVLVIFTVDYLTRLFLSKDKKQFLLRNIPDLVAIIPFDNIFRLARLARIARLVRLIRLLRAGLILRRFSATLFGILETNGLKYLIIVTVIIIILGSLGIQYLEKDIGNIKNFGDALWWSLVTTTTVGYGDISPSTSGGRILAAFLMIFGIGFLGMITASIATYFVERLNSCNIKTSINDEIKFLIKSKIEDLENLSEPELEDLIRVIKLYKHEKNK
jgi:voltage-gated potassium channel